MADSQGRSLAIGEVEPEAAKWGGIRDLHSAGRGSMQLFANISSNVKFFRLFLWVKDALIGFGHFEGSTLSP